MKPRELAREVYEAQRKLPPPRRVSLLLEDGFVRIEVGESSSSRWASWELDGEAAADPDYYHSLRVLLRRGPWLEKTTVGCLRWLSKLGTGLTVAGDPFRDNPASASTRSRLARAGLVHESQLWGMETANECLYLTRWACCELRCRGQEGT